MKTFIFAAVILGAFCALQVSANLSCYNCTRCEKVNDDTANCTGKICLTVSTTTSGTTSVDRSCGTLDDCSTYGGADSGCNTTAGVATCCCKTAKCNGVAAMTSAALVVMASVVTGIFFSRF